VQLQLSNTTHLLLTNFRVSISCLLGPQESFCKACAYHGGLAQPRKVRRCSSLLAQSLYCSQGLLECSWTVDPLCSEAVYGEALASYLDDPGNLFVISSDFCHWGTRFNYTYYNQSQVSYLATFVPLCSEHWIGCWY
jgi:Memo-like protein